MTTPAVVDRDGDELSSSLERPAENVNARRHGMSEVTTSDASVPSLPYQLLDAAPEAAARVALFRCCGSTRWVAGMLARRPFGSSPALERAAQAVWSALKPADYLEAFAANPPIGEDAARLRQRFATTAAWSSAEQAGVAGAAEETLERLASGNRRYRARFGYTFIVCAAGRSAGEMLALLEARLANEPATEFTLAAGEQEKITRLRLQQLDAEAFAPAAAEPQRR